MGQKNNTSKKLRRQIKNLKKRIASDSNDAKAESQSSQSSKNKLIGFDEKKLLDLAVDIWKLEKNIGKAIDLEANRPLKSSLSKLRDYVGSYKIETLDYDGEKYHEKLNVKILSSEQDDGVSEPVIVETIKPAVLFDGKLVSHASVIINMPVDNSKEG